MTEIKAFQNPAGEWTLGVTDGDLTEEDGFDTAIAMSLFTDARAPDNAVAIPEKRRGWMGNLESPVEGREFGGLLWLVDQSKLTQDTLNISVNYAQLALQWFIEDLIATSVVVTGEIVPRSGIRLKVVFTAKSGKVSTHYFNLWEQTGVKNAA